MCAWAPFEYEISVGRERLYEEAYRELCEIVTGHKPTDPPPSEKEFIPEVVAFLRDDPGAQLIREKVCEEFRWCEKRDKLKNLEGFTLGLLTLIGTVTESLGCGVLTGVWILTVPMLNEICGC